ncbi:unnamed protein product [Linum tenue]|uniref:F-box domain-containing protein n=1 Tax=Linum tenue TaxID=586396 RepID=A0AAV0NN00_9ROSI|nr:unnamed protein product [Linum tenue]
MEKAGEEAGESKKNRGGSCCCMINDAGEYLLSEILVRLPLDQIFRCKSVCKHWLSVVENPLFAAYYTSKEKKQSEKEEKKKKKSDGVSYSVKAHPHQRTPILIPVNEDHGERVSEKLKFSLDFVPDFAQLHGDTKFYDLLNLAAEHQKKVRNSWAWGVPNYYTFRELILGSSNGLLLCAPLLSATTKGPTGITFDGFAPIYVVCNPHTKQWLQVPPPFTSPVFSHEIAHVGFVSDFDSHGVCWFKIVRFPLSFDYQGRRSLDLQVFSSQSWKWMAVKVSSLPQPFGPDKKMQTIVAVTLKKNGDDSTPRLCWMFKGSQAIVYDPINNVVDVVIKVIRPSNLGTVQDVVFDGMCVSKGQLWAGKLFDGMKLKIYRASGNEWETVKEFDMKSVKNKHNRDHHIQQQIRRISFRAFVTMNPDDPEQVYLRYNKSLALLDMRCKTYKVVGALDMDKDITVRALNRKLEQSAIICDNPLWPTPLPSPFPSSSSS